MDDLTPDRARSLDRLQRLVGVETPSGDASASRAIVELLAGWWDAAGARVRVEATASGTDLVADLDGEGAPLLLIGHSDTVWPRGALEGELPWSVDGDIVRGPGVYDMKAGLVVMLAAVERLGARRRRAVRVVIVSDEEIGSPHSGALIRACADGVAAAIGFESPHPDGALKVGRRGSTRLRLDVTGRAAHAALDPGAGVSAVDELVDQLVALRRIVGDGEAAGTVLCNVGSVRGGTRANVVPAHAEAEVGLRFSDPATETQVLARIAGLEAVRPGAVIAVETLSSRPTWSASGRDTVFVDRIADVAQAIGQEVAARPADGAGDANTLGSLGIPTVDGFGPRGGGAHALSEHVSLASLWQRIDLLAAVLADDPYQIMSTDMAQSA